MGFFNNTINIERLREYADKFLRDGLFLYLVYYNLINDAQYNIPVQKYYKARAASKPTESDFIEFVYCYLAGLSNNIDIDATSTIAKPSTAYAPAYFNTYATSMQSIQNLITNKPRNYAEQRSCLNPDFYKVVSRFIGHLLTKYNSTTPAPIDIKYAHEHIIGVDGNIFYGSDIFTLANKILSLESKIFSNRKESLMLELYKSLELPKHLKEFSDRYKDIFTNTTIANNLILAGGGIGGGGGGSDGGSDSSNNELPGKTRKYKPSRSAKLTMIIKKYNEKTKKNLFQEKAACNCVKPRHTKKLIDF